MVTRNQQISTNRTGRRTFLKGLTGAITTSAAVSTLTGTAAAHFPPELDVEITPYRGDEDDENRLNRRGCGFVRVAVTNIDDVEPTPESTRFRFGAPDAVADGGGAEAAEKRQLRDVNGDGIDDLVLRFRLSEAGFTGDESEGELRWDRDETREHGLSGVDTVSFRHDGEANGNYENG